MTDKKRPSAKRYWWPRVVCDCGSVFFTWRGWYLHARVMHGKGSSDE